MTLPIPLRSSNAYIGIGKQTVGGTAVNPTQFPRWLDGSKLDTTIKETRILEGDGTRRASQVIKSQQMTKVSLVCYPRPQEVGFLETAAMGAGSDAFTISTVSNTLSSSSAVGATSVSLSTNTGLSGSGSIALAFGGANFEVATFTLPATGSGPYTLNVAASYNGGAGLKLAHANSVALANGSTHVITDQNDGTYYTVEVGLGNLNGGAGPTIRVRDCKVDTVKRTSKPGELLEYTIEFVGISSTSTGTPSTVLLEAANPFYYDTGTWTLDGATTGDAPYIETFAIQQKNGVDTGIQSEQLTLDALIYGAVEVTLTVDAVFTSPSRLYNIFYGSATGTTDSQTLDAGSLSLTFAQVDGFHSLTYAMTTIDYVKAAWPVPKANGKHYTLSFEGESTTNQGVNPYVLQATVVNARSSVY